MLHSLPLFHRLAGRPVIVLGEGEAAEAKRRLLERAGAEVVGADDGRARLAFVALDEPEQAAAALQAHGDLAHLQAMLARVGRNRAALRTGQHGFYAATICVRKSQLYAAVKALQPHAGGAPEVAVEVDLPEGGRARVLVPQVYLAAASALPLRAAEPFTLWGPPVTPTVLLCAADGRDDARKHVRGDGAEGAGIISEGGGHELDVHVGKHGRQSGHEGGDFLTEARAEGGERAVEEVAVAIQQQLQAGEHAGVVRDDGSAGFITLVCQRRERCMQVRW